MAKPRLVHISTVVVVSCILVCAILLFEVLLYGHLSPLPIVPAIAREKLLRCPSPIASSSPSITSSPPPQHQTPTTTDNLVSSLTAIASTVSEGLKDETMTIFSMATEPPFLAVGLPRSKTNSQNQMNVNLKVERDHFTLLKQVTLHAAAKQGYPRDYAVVDAGANHGVFSLYAGVLGVPHIVALEPQTTFARLTSMSVGLNGLASQVTVLRRAVLDRSNVKIGMNSGGDGQLVTIQTPDTPSVNDYALTIRLDELPGIPAGTRIAFLKIDVEGVELKALKSASKLFAAGLVDNVLVEWGDSSRWKVTDSTPSEALEVLMMMEGWGLQLSILNFEMCNAWRSELAVVHPVVNISHNIIKSTDFQWLTDNCRSTCYYWWSKPSFWTSF